MTAETATSGNSYRAGTGEIPESISATVALSELRLRSRPDGSGHRKLVLSVPGMHCGACVHAIEKALAAVEGVQYARANLSARSVTVRWREVGNQVPPLLEALARTGFEAHFPSAIPAGADNEVRGLLRALAVAGFGTGNIMLLSVSIWSGADPETRDLFHWISAAIALPILAYSGQPFFRPAIAALRHGRTNMDVPISIGVLLAYALSLYDTVHGREHAYFDAAVSLVFFLLAGRTLEAAMRKRARSAADGLRGLAPQGATVVGDEGSGSFLPITEISPGMRIRIGPGDIVPTDGHVLDGSSAIDASLATGESAPLRVGPGSHLLAGTRNLTAPVVMQVSHSAGESFLATIVELVEQAEAGRVAYRGIADRVSRLYAPVVHLAAVASALGWLLAGSSLHDAITIAVAVLIITCPCALGLAAPLVQAIAVRRLFRMGILARSGEALERLGSVDAVLFDKTGVITSGQAQFRLLKTTERDAQGLAQALAAHSRHPYAKAIAAAPSADPPVEVRQLTEHPGDGIEAIADGARVRLGRPAWALDDNTVVDQDAGQLPCSVLSRNGMLVSVFCFEDPLRKDARQAIEALTEMSIAVAILSGDRPAPVRRAAEQVAVARATAELRPEDKRAHVEAVARRGNLPLMVGDGLNDAPALAAAHVSMAPAEATEIGRNAADFVFLRQSLRSVPEAIHVARRVNAVMRQNFAFAIGYNMLALPLAVAGYVTPLVAAIAMSSSSLIVAANALRLNLSTGHRRNREPSLTEAAN